MQNAIMIISHVFSLLLLLRLSMIPAKELPIGRSLWVIPLPNHGRIVTTPTTECDSKRSR
ncbi:uncharacterized protein BO87DRAFT_379082 [Aspergillus neoniger CBS 115656]|uniref:Uncharacterized protein n=1 Tax=Aspergillus neoniger (strain CBS 115656) TaxID=1448310 RepID=A0A318YAV2_ASPNB|nr:hypothetical protein BO87DRAFT_379082 [Aspergillus neoniger CBS 115656]PYH31179.1 hypothetical protein BO87DRAFT_379082 [Aspergillus neoniger CBS 115656]